MTAARGQTLYFRATTGLGFGVLALAAVEATAAPLAVLALGAAAVIATEVVQVPGDDRSLDPLDAQPFSFSSPAHLALVIAVGVWPAVLLAGAGVVVVDLLRGAPKRAIAFNASVFALATAGGGAAFALAGGTAGSLALPADFPAYAALAVVYILLNLTLVNTMAALGSGRAPLAEVRDVLAHRHLVADRRGGPRPRDRSLRPLRALGARGLRAARDRGLPRLRAARRAPPRDRPGARDLCERRRRAGHLDLLALDPSRRRRRGAGTGARLPAAQVGRLRWAGRLHDLGKIAVDSSVLNKPGPLDDAEFEAMRRHARLSARLLRRFRLAADEARAVEYHHERYDGRGYYGIHRDDVPLAAFFLAVADSFDAMTSDRAYRPGMSEEDALAEIERCAGTHFHPGVARAFVAMKRGADPRLELSRTELRSFANRTSRPAVPSWATGLSAATLVALLGTVASLLALAIGSTAFALAGGIAALGGLLWRRRDVRSARGLATCVREAIGPAAHPFPALVRALSRLESLDWIGVVRWDVETMSGRVELERGGLTGFRPTDDAITSWLVRDADGGELLVAAGAEVRLSATLVALPLGVETTPAPVWLVLSFRHDRPGWLDQALLDVQDDLAAAFPPVADTPPPASNPSQRCPDVPPAEPRAGTRLRVAARR